MLAIGLRVNMLVSELRIDGVGTQPIDSESKLRNDGLGVNRLGPHPVNTKLGGQHVDSEADGQHIDPVNLFQN